MNVLLYNASPYTNNKKDALHRSISFAFVEKQW